MSSNPPVLVNGRVLKLKANGQKRVAEELIRRIPALIQVTPSQGRSSGLAGHAWEQFYLPVRAGKSALWSPSTSGPVLHRNHVVTTHDVAFIDIPQFFSKEFARWYATLTARLARSVRHTVTVSEFTRKRVIEEFRVSSDKVTAIHPGITSPFRERSGREIADVLARRSIERGSYIMGFLGTDPRKNTSGLIEAWAQSGAAKQGASLVLFGRVGNKSVFAADKPRQEREGIITLGAVDDDELAALYSGAQGFIFPSYYEGFGLPIVEAAHCGCRIVTSDTSAMPEVSPSDATLLSPLDTAGIAEAIRHLLTVSDTSEARAKRIAEMERFSWDKAASRYSQLFAEVFAG